MKHAVRATSAIAGRELLSLFVTPLAYVVGTLFLLLQGYNFALLLHVLNDPLAAAGPVMQYYFGGSFFIFWLPVIFLCAALSMRLIAEERRQGTLEALLTAPVTPAQVVLGKYVGVLAFYVALWLPTGMFVVLLRGAGAQPDMGPIASGYLGTLLVGASFLAVGLLMSAWTRSQLQAVISTSVLCTLSVLAGLLVDQVDAEAWVHVLQATSLLSMMQELAQGIVDTRWIGLHLAVVGTALAGATLAIDPRRNADQWIRWAAIAVALGHAHVLVGQVASREDWTASQIYALSDRAREVLGDLEGPIDVRVVVPQTLGAGRPNPLAQELREVLARMTESSDALRVEILDPDRDRQRAEQLVASFGLGGRDLADGVVLVRKGQGAQQRREHVMPGDLVTYATGELVAATGPRIEEFRGEEALLRAFVAVSQPFEVTACATAGHGEPRLDNLEPFDGYAHLSDLLKGAGVQLRAADLDSADGLSGCDIVLVAGPSGLFPPTQVQTLRRFLDAGGSMLVLAGAVLTRGSTELARNGLEPLLSRYGIDLGGRMVLDADHPMPGATPLLAFTLDTGWGDHPIVRSLAGRSMSFVVARELMLRAAEDGSKPTWLIRTGDAAWAESQLGGLHRGDPPQFDPGEDRRGPIVLAAAAQLGTSRVVVVGSDQFARNAYLRDDVVFDHGRDLILNAVGWLSSEDILLGVRPRARETVKLVLMPDQLARMVRMCVFGLPGFALALAGWVLWRRRR